MIVTSLLTENILKQNYDALTNGQFSSIPTPVAFIPVVQSTDNFITRYFVQRGNGGIIIEVASSNYNDLVGSAFYNYVSLNWSVRGVPHTTKDPIQGTIEGVAEYNQAQLQVAEQTLPELSKKLINLLDLYQGT